MPATTTTENEPSSAPPGGRRDRTHWLYLAVIAAVLLGIAVGFLASDVAVELKPLGEGFVALIKMMISPIIFCTIVLGVGSVAKAAQVGKVGGLAMGYFLVMSTVALVIGLVVGEGSGSTVDFLLGIIPTTLVSAFTEGEVLQTLLVALLVGFALQSMGRRGEPILRGVGHLQRRRAEEPRRDHAGVLRHVPGVRGGRARHPAHAHDGHQPVPAAALPGPRVPADRVDVVVRDSAPPADRKDGALRCLPPRGRDHRADRLLVQPGRDRDLPDDGLDLHRRGPQRPAVHRRADLAPGVHDPFNEATMVDDHDHSPGFGDPPSDVSDVPDEPSVVRV